MKGLLLPQTLTFHPKPQTPFPLLRPSKIKSQHRHADPDEGIPSDLVKTVVKFKSRHNYIRVLQVSPTAAHPFRGSRLLLLDSPGNIHSISFPSSPITHTYLDVFASLPPLLPQSPSPLPLPLALLGLGAGSAARSLLHLYPDSPLLLHGWEIDPAVVDVGREYFGLAKLESRFPDKLVIHIGDALKAKLKGDFSGIVVDLFSKGSLLPELQDPETWQAMKGRLREGGRIMVNVGGSCVEAEDWRRDGRAVMEQTLGAMAEVFSEDGLSVLSLGNEKDDSSVALTGPLGPGDRLEWKKKLPRALQCYPHMWTPYPGV